MADKYNPSKNAAERDYEKKFNPTEQGDPKNARDLRDKEETGDANWKTVAKKKSGTSDKKGRFGFSGRRAGKLRHASAFGFIAGIVLLGVWYTSIFAPNILLVNMKEMYTNDLADATIALDTYYKKMMNYKIGRSNCSEKDSIKCKLSTMSRTQKLAFEKRGFTVIGSKIQEDNLDDGVSGNDMPEQRYQVTAIVPPIQSPGIIATGDMLWAYAQLSTANKALVHGVFDPKSGFFMDKRFSQRLKDKYDLTKRVTINGRSEQQVNRSFDKSMTGNNEGIDIYGRPNANGGLGLGTLRSPIVAANMQIAAQNLSTQSYSYVGVQCAWYAFGKSVTNNAKTAKAHTIARFAMQYLKQADAVKAGIAEEVPTNILSSKLAASINGGFNGPNATDSSMYKAIVHNNLPIPSPFGLLYYLDTFDLIAALAPAWSQIMVTATAVGGAAAVPGSLYMPPANLTGADREYCLAGETLQNHDPYKEADCAAVIAGSAPPGWQGALAPILKIGKETCPKPHIDTDEGFPKIEGEYYMQPSLRATEKMLTPYIAGIFSANVIAWANAMYLLFTSQTKGVPASDALFAGTGEILGDMAMSRGMMPSNAVYMAEYLTERDKLMSEYEEVARYNAKKDQFNIYNKYSFLGSIANSLSPVYDKQSIGIATIGNIVSTLGSAVRQLNPKANAIYYLQPAPFNPMRLSCPDPEYLAIGIMADTACNVRYSFSRLELAAQVDSVLDYMTQSHTDAYQDKITELTERQSQADPEEGDAENVGRQLALVTAVSGQPFIDKRTGKATPGSEYEKFLDYCVNRQDPWGRSGIHVVYSDIPKDERDKRIAARGPDGQILSQSDRGDPYQRISISAHAAVVEGTSIDQDWYSGKKCTEQSEMITNFRAYTMMCSVDGSLSGGVDCTDTDRSNSYSDDFYMTNDILYTSWN